MLRCAVQNYKNFSEKTSSDVSYHTSPKDARLSKVWKFTCTRKYDFNTQAVRVCSAHFALDDFVRDLQAKHTGQERRRHLKPNVVPHLNLQHKMEDVPSARSDRLKNRKMKQKIIGEISDCMKQVAGDTNI
ncbi:hypothetical protein PR048_015402 [Dryococelus australis]|uniref:THAP-type domain-containing protein n=1 Tax=Dryococelus australis TaxID=614101 RepID=A0ABQ9HGV8_9NEOP|nr:hypothetical protein PR048_015402 [Dryococelus australis]